MYTLEELKQFSPTELEKKYHQNIKRLGSK